MSTWLQLLMEAIKALERGLIDENECASIKQVALAGVLNAGVEGMDAPTD